MKHSRLFWCTGEPAEKERKSFPRKQCSDSKKHCDSLTVQVPKLWESWKETFPCRVVHDANNNTVYKHTITCMTTLLTLKMLYVLSEFKQ